MILTRDQILQVSDLDKRTVEVPEWKGEVILRTMTGTERDAWETSLFEIKGKSQKTNMKNMRAKLLAMCIVDEEDKKIFTDKDIQALGEKSSKALNRLYTVASELNGIGVEDEEELVKN